MTNTIILQVKKAGSEGLRGMRTSSTSRPDDVSSRFCHICLSFVSKCTDCPLMLGISFQGHLYNILVRLRECLLQNKGQLSLLAAH